MMRVNIVKKWIRKPLGGGEIIGPRTSKEEEEEEEE
jgi:hypothetical protein